MLILHAKCKIHPLWEAVVGGVVGIGLLVTGLVGFLVIWRGPLERGGG